MFVTLLEVVMGSHKKQNHSQKEILEILNRNLETFSRDKYPLWDERSLKRLSALKGQVGSIYQFMLDFEKPEHNMKLAMQEYSIDDTGVPVDEYVSKDAIVINDKRDTEVIYLKKKVDKLTSGIKYYKDRLDRSVEERTLVIAPKRYDDFTNSKSDKILYLCFADWHNFEYVNPQFVNGVNRYTAEDAVERLESITKKAMALIKLIAPKKVRVVYHGDILAGYIHQENGFNSKMAYETQNITEDMMVSSLMNIHAVAPIDKIICLSGNHGRYSKKVLPKEFYADNLDNIIYERVKRSCRNTIDSKKFKISLSPWYFDTIDSNAIMLGHGDKSLGQIGNVQRIQTSLVRVIEGVRRNEISANELTDGVKENVNFSRVLGCVIGHYHKILYDETLSIPMVIVPSLMGVNEFGYHSLGALNPSAQSALCVSDQAGIESFHVLNPK